jgi:uncharacterized low-complexity protein
MKLRQRAGLATGLVALGLLAAAPAGAAGPANVDVRVEGATETLVPETRVTTTATPVGKPGEGTCSGTSALGALDRATDGDWAGPFGGFGYELRTIKGETHWAPGGSDPAPYWTFWVNYRVAEVGLCDAELQEGDEVLLFPDCYGSQCSGPSPTPLRISGVPGRAAPGQAATVKVEEFTVSAGWPPVTTAVPAAGATVTAGGSVYTTAADGTAVVTFAGSGPQTVRATKSARVRSAAERVCVTTGADGACGTATSELCVTSGGDGRCGTADSEAPRATILGIEDGQRFSRRTAPRTLQGTVTADPTGLRAVKLRLTRQVGRQCWKYSGRYERFQSKPCGRRAWFKIGDRQDWSYLLPSRLGKGRYVLDVSALDNARNRDALVRGRTRLVFHVR